MLHLDIPAAAFPLVKQIFEFGAEEAPIDVTGASQSVNQATLVNDDSMCVQFATDSDVEAFRACITVGGEDNAAVSHEVWESVFRPLL